MVIGLLLAARCAQLGLTNWDWSKFDNRGLSAEQIDDGMHIYHQRCYIGLVVSSLIAMLGVLVGFGRKVAARFALILIPLVCIVLFAFGRIIL